MKKALFISIVNFLLLISCNETVKEKEVDLPFYNSAEYNPEWITVDSPEYDSIHTISDFSLVNQLGETISDKTIENKIFVVNFFFTSCPGICPRMTNNLNLVQDEFINDDEVLILSHSVTPELDGIEQLKIYGDINKINPNKWHLLTGDKNEIYKLGRLSYFVDEGFGKSVTDINEFLHTENIILVDQKRRIRGVYSGTSELEVRNLIKDIKLLRKM